MKTTKLLALLLIATPLVAIAAPGTGPYEIVSGPSSLSKDWTYMVVTNDRQLAIVPFDESKDCARFVADLKGECISGAEAIKRFPDWAKR